MSTVVSTLEELRRTGAGYGDPYYSMEYQYCPTDNDKFRIELTDAQFKGYEAGWPKPGYYFVVKKTHDGKVSSEKVGFHSLPSEGQLPPGFDTSSQIQQIQLANETIFKRYDAMISAAEQRAKEAESQLEVLKKANSSVALENFSLRHDYQALTLKLQEQQKGIKNMTDTKTPSTFSTMDLMGEAQNGGWQALADEAAKRTRTVLLAQLKKAKAGSMIIEGTRVFLHTEFGLAVWSFGLGMFLPYIPKAAKSAHVMRVATELRTGGFRHAFGAMADKIVDVVTSVVSMVDMTESVVGELGEGTKVTIPRSNHTNGTTKVNGAGYHPAS